LSRVGSDYPSFFPQVITGTVFGPLTGIDLVRRPANNLEPPKGIEPMTYSLRGSYIHRRHTTGWHLPCQPKRLSWVSLTGSRSCMSKKRPHEPARRLDVRRARYRPLGRPDEARFGRAQSRAATARVARGDSLFDAFHFGSTTAIAFSTSSVRRLRKSARTR
jgi:hypothetical protein